MFPSDATDPQMLVRDADTAMYNVKESGRGAYRYFSAEMNTRMQERLHLEIGLRRAIAERQFELAYQPKVKMERTAPGRDVGRLPSLKGTQWCAGPYNRWCLTLLALKP